MKALETLRSRLPKLWKGGTKREVPEPRRGASESFLTDFDRTFDGLWDRFFDDPWRLPAPLGPSTRWDLTEDDDGFTLEVELPGYEPADLEVSVSRDRVSIRAQHDEEEKRSRRRSDSGFHSRRRVALDLPLPAEVDRDAASAELRHGVLRVRLAKTEQVRRRVRRVPVAA